MNDTHSLFGIYPATCRDISDPQNRSRIRVSSSRFYGTEMSNWVEPCLPVTSNGTHSNHTSTVTSSSSEAHTHTVSLNLNHSNHVKVPNLGQTVWIMFIGGNPDFPVWIGVGTQ